MIRLITNTGKRNLVAKICTNETICLITDGSCSFEVEMHVNFGEGSVRFFIEYSKQPEAIIPVISKVKRSQDFDYFVLYFNVPEADIIEFAKDFETHYSIPEGKLILACRQ